MVAVLLLGLAGCWKPSDTGPSGMVGTIQEASGAPLAGVQVQTIETHTTTDAEGGFAVNYKEPSQWLEFERDGVRFRRFYRPEDERRHVGITLPELAPVRIGCDMDAGCVATLTWKLDDGLVAIAPATCDRDASTVIVAAPPGVPDEVSCRRSAAAPDEPAVARKAPGGLLITPPLVPLRIELTTTTKPLPRSCAVTVDGEPAQTVEDGVYRAQVFGFVTVEATCDGIPAAPRRLYVRDEAKIDLPWSQNTPRFVPPPQGPEADALVLAQVDGLNRGWTLVLPAAADHSVALPPLGPGTYVIGAHMTPERVAAVQPDEALAHGVLHWRLLDQAAWSGDQPEALGVLVLDDAMNTGTLPVQIYETVAR